MRALLACTSAVAIGCAAARTSATITILKANGNPATPGQATKTFNPQTGGWTIVLKALYDVGGWSRYDIRGNGGEIIDEIVIDVPCWMVNGACQPAGSPAVANVYSDPPLGITTVKSIVQTGTAETIVSDVTVEQDLGSVDVEVIGTLRAGRDVIGPVHSRTADNPNRGITKIEAQRDILGDVTAENGRITFLLAYGTIGKEDAPVTIRAKHDITQIAGIGGVYADINTRCNGGAGHIFAFGASRFAGRLETEALYANPHNGWPGRIYITEALDGTIILGKSFNDPSQWMEVPTGGLHGQIVINADNIPGGTWTSPVYIGDVEAEDRIILTGNGYAPAAADLGGGSVGLAPFALHAQSCAPPSGSMVTPAPGMALLLRHYGPITTNGGPPVTIERRSLAGPGPWSPANLAAFSITVDPADANTLRVAPAPSQGGFAGGFEYRITPTSQLRSDVLSAPAVTWAAPYTILVENDHPPCAGNTNGDAVVDALDLLYMLIHWGGSDPVADLNGNGVVDAVDYLMMISNWGPC